MIKMEKRNPRILKVHANFKDLIIELAQQEETSQIEITRELGKYKEEIKKVLNVK
jgi:hypothetical protein